VQKKESPSHVWFTQYLYLGQRRWHVHSISQQRFFEFSLLLSLTSISTTSMVMVIFSVIARTLLMLLHYQGSHNLLAVTFPRFYFLQILVLRHSTCFKSNWSSSAKKPTQKCLSTLSMHWSWGL